MRLSQVPSEFQKALPVLEKIKAAGFEAYFVGGCVRDALLGRPIHDVDIATSSYPQETKAIFPRTADVGIEHGTVLVLEEGQEYEVTTFRTEDVYVDYRRPSSVSFVRSLAEDLKRRDFTVNAFALDEEGQVIDLFDGLTDLDHKILRAVGVASERFNEDALRIMRGLRFAASLDFKIADETLEAMKSHAPLLEKISVERTFIELDKLLMAPHWQKGLTYLLTCQAFLYLPELADKKEAIQTFKATYPETFCFSSSEQAWAAFLLALEVFDVKSFLKKWKTPVAFQRQVADLVAISRNRASQPVTKQEVYRYGKQSLLLAEALLAARGETVDVEIIDQLDRELVIHSKQDMAINGGQLMQAFGLKPGPVLGQLLTAVETALVAGDLTNDQATILAFVARLLEEKGASNE